MQSGKTADVSKVVAFTQRDALEQWVDGRGRVTAAVEQLGAQQQHPASTDSVTLVAYAKVQ